MPAGGAISQCRCKTATNTTWSFWVLVYTGYLHFKVYIFFLSVLLDVLNSLVLIIGVTDQFRWGGGGLTEVSCPNVFSNDVFSINQTELLFCPNITCFLFENGHFKSTGFAPPPPPLQSTAATSSAYGSEYLCQSRRHFCLPGYREKMWKYKI